MIYNDIGIHNINNFIIIIIIIILLFKFLKYILIIMIQVDNKCTKQLCEQFVFLLGCLGTRTDQALALTSNNLRRP